MLKDTLNVWHKAGFYHIRHNGKIKTFANYIDAKAHVESIMQSVFFHQSVAA